MLKIGEVAEATGISASVIRSWEKLGIIHPVRTDSKYRLYSKDDVKVLKRARYLSRVRGMNAPAIVELLKSQGIVKTGRSDGPGAMGSATAAIAGEPVTSRLLRWRGQWESRWDF